MFVHRGPQRLAIASSHRVPHKVPQQNPLPAPYAPKSPRIRTSTSKEAQNRERVLSAFDTAWKATAASALSKDGVLRAAAHEMVHKARTSPMIDRFPKVLMAYAAATMGYEDRHVVEAFVLIRMKQMLSDRYDEQFEQIRKKSVRRMSNPVIAKKVARSECRAVDRTIAETLANAVIAATVTHLMDLAKKGRRLRHELPRGYIGVQIRVAGIGRTTGMVLILDEEEGDFCIKALKTIKEFDRMRRSHFRKKRRTTGYSNRPPNLRH